MLRLVLTIKALGFCLVVFLLNPVDLFSQTVYAAETTPYFHRANCKIKSKTSTAMDLSRAAMIGKTPCKKCKPPTKALKGGTKKKTAKPKPKPAPAK